MSWTIIATDEVDGWLKNLAVRDRDAFRQVTAALDVLADEGPGLGRPLVDQITHSRLCPT